VTGSGIIRQMKILSRYIALEFMGNAVLGLMIFTFILILDQLFELVDLLLNKGVGILFTLKLLLLLTPSSLSLTLPVSILLACLLTYGRLSENNEITAARASGLAAWSYVRMPFFVAVLTTVFLVPFNTRWAPHAHASFRELYVQVLKKNPLVRIDEKTFVEVGDYHIYVEDKDKKSKNMRGLTIYKMPTKGPSLRIFASRGHASFDEKRGITFSLSAGRIEQADAANPSRWVTTDFKEYQFFIPLVGSQSSTERAIEEMDNKQLRAEIETLKSKNLPTPVHACQIQFRWALAFTPILFAALGVPLAIRMQRGGRSIGFGMSLIIVIVYYVLLMGGMSLGQRGAWPAWLAVWSANGILAVAASGLFWKMTKR
jgi:lipopolysaccharide export system permease protein